ncbi:MAG: hypothetical protein FJ128_13785 [Deltaproteobacteria bacterium]|nr:hypothetical protein [Deltaproteobacteria bacterium]
MSFLIFSGYFLYLLIVTITSAPFFIKHFPEASFILITTYIAIITGLIILGFIFLRFDSQKFRIISNHSLWVLGILALAALNVFLYPATRLVSNPSTAPNALMEPAIALWHTCSHPYSIRLFDGAPISPGPGWILLNLPFSLSGMIALLIPIYFMIAGVMVAKWGKAYVFIFVMLLMASLNFLQMSITGHDLPATTLALVSLTLGLHCYYRSNGWFIVIAILTGLIATARMPFIIIPMALSICLITINPLRAMQFALISIGVALSIHLIFFVWAKKIGLFYQPMHVFGRASASGSTIFLCSGALTCVTFYWFVWRRLTNSPASWLIFLWVILSTPFIFVGLGELLREGLFSFKTWAVWEGKNYVLFTLPLLLAGLLLNEAQRCRN